MMMWMVLMVNQLLILVCKLKMVTNWNFEINKFANFLSTLMCWQTAMQAVVMSAMVHFLFQLYPTDIHCMLSLLPTQMSFLNALLALCGFVFRCGNWKMTEKNGRILMKFQLFQFFSTREHWKENISFKLNIKGEREIKMMTNGDKTVFKLGNLSINYI